MIIPAHLEELCLAPLPEVQLQYSRLWLVWKCLFFCSSSSSSTSPQVYINALVLVCIVTSQLPSTLHYLKKKQKTCFIVDLVKCPVRRRLFNVYGWSPQYQCFVSVRSKVVVVWNLKVFTTDRFTWCGFSVSQQAAFVQLTFERERERSYWGTVITTYTVTGSFTEVPKR